MIVALIRLTTLLLGGHVRCGACGHRVNLATIVPHCRVRHPDLMRRTP